MKKINIHFLLLLLCSLAALPLALQAQNYLPASEGYLYQQGKILKVQKGNLVPLANNIILNNGVTVLPSGELVKPNGKKHTLREGQAIDKNGRILFPETRRDGSIILIPSPGNSSFRPSAQHLKNIPRGKAHGLQKAKGKGRHK